MTMKFNVTKTLAALALIAPLAAPNSAAAEGWSISDLGNVSSRDSCMDRAVNALETWPSNRRTDVSRGNWAVYAYNLSPG